MIVEIAISTIDRSYVSRGDIIVVRKPSQGVGLKELRTLIWLRVKGLVWNEMTQLSHPITGKDGRELQKRRFCIPLLKLNEKLSELKLAKRIQKLNIDIERAENSALVYQPLIAVDSIGLFSDTITPPVVLSVFDLVWDKEKNQYLELQFMNKVKNLFEFSRLNKLFVWRRADE